MISAREAWKVTQEARTALRLKMSLEQARALEAQYQAIMTTVDFAVREAMEKGESEVTVKWAEFHTSLRERFTDAAIEWGYGFQSRIADDGEYEVTLNWEAK